MTAVPRQEHGNARVRDGMPWLPSAVASILEQTCRDFELIVLFSNPQNTVTFVSNGIGRLR